MEEAVKFTFDEMFDDTVPGTELSGQERTRSRKMRWTEEEIEALKAEARAEGAAEAMASNETKLAELNTAALGNIAEAAAAGLSSLTRVQNDMQSDAAALAFSVARKLADVLISLRPEAEIEAVIRECLLHLNREPRLVIRVNDTLAEQVEESIQQTAVERGMNDKIMIVSDPAIATGDCEIEWSDGGVVRSRAELDRQAAEIIDRYIETLSGGDDQAANMENHHG